MEESVQIWRNQSRSRAVRLGAAHGCLGWLSRAPLSPTAHRVQISRRPAGSSSRLPWVALTGSSLTHRS
uniref:Uncharacterized protein n=1 Tax=Fagus sylvatica TaxID=28930 RepID=A0A2N9IY13_FAGSY